MILMILIIHQIKSEKKTKENLKNIITLIWYKKITNNIKEYKEIIYRYRIRIFFLIKCKMDLTKKNYFDD